MINSPSIQCGESDERNLQADLEYSDRKYFSYLLSAESPVIFDVGAHKGESARFFSSLFPHCSLYCFEPNPQSFEVLDQVLSQLATESISDKFEAKGFNLAVGRDSQKVTFYLQDKSHLCGLIPINKSSCDSLGYAQSALNASMKVDQIALDGFNLPVPDILKIDVQGGELEVLIGAEKLLSEVSVCMVEVSFFDFYDKRTSLAEVSKLLEKSGLHFWDITKISKNPKNLRTDWVEFVFARTPRPSK